MITQQKVALIVGAGDGLSASLAHLFAREGMKIGLAARNADKLADLIVNPSIRQASLIDKVPWSIAN